MLDAYLDRTRIPLKIDISTGDVITPGAVEYSFHLMFEERSIPVWAYNLETVMAAVSKGNGAESEKSD